MNTTVYFDFEQFQNTLIFDSKKTGHESSRSKNRGFSPGCSEAIYESLWMTFLEKKPSYWRLHKIQSLKLVLLLVHCQFYFLERCPVIRFYLRRFFHINNYFCKCLFSLYFIIFFTLNLLESSNVIPLTIPYWSSSLISRFSTILIPLENNFYFSSNH